MGYVGKIKDSSGTTHLVASTLFGTCSTAIGTAAKVVTCSNFSQLENGVTIHVYFVNGNTAASPTLNINSTGAIAIKRYNTTAPQCSTQNWAAGQIVSFTYYEVSSTDKRWVMNDIDQRFDLLTGTGETAQDKGEGVSPRYFPAKWKFNLNKQPQDGDIITIRIPCAGHSYGVYISLDNGTNYKPVSVNSTTRLTTHYANGKTITLVYESAGSTATIYPVNGGDATQTVDGGCWTVLNYYDANSDTKVRQTLTNGNTNRPILLSYANNTTTTGNVDNICYRDNDFYYNPSTNILTISGNIYYKSSTYDGSATNNGVSSGTAYPTTFNVLDKSDRILTRLEGMINSNGKIGAQLYVRNYTSSGTQVAQKGIKMEMDKNGTMTYTVSDGSAFRTAIGAGTSDLVIGTTSTTAMAGDTTFPLSIATDTGTNQLTLSANTKYKLTAGGSTYIFTTPPDNNTTYTFEDGTNGFTVITNGSGVQTVTVTPSITNNITGSGTSGYLAKFNGTNTITNGPQLGSSTTTYLRNDGTWNTPTDTKNTAGSNNSTSSLYLIGATSQTTGSNGVQTYSNSGLVYDGTSHTLKIGTGNAMGTIQLQAGSTELYNTIIPGLNSQPTSHTLPSSSGTLLNDTDYNSREVTIYTSYNNTMDQGTITKEITGYRDKIKYIDIYYTDNNFYKNGYMGVVSENTNMKRILYSQIPKNDPSITYRVSLDLFGDQSSLYLRKHTYYIYESVFQNDNNRFNLCVQPIDGNNGVIVQFVGTPGSGSWGNMTVRAQYGRFIKIYQINLILEA